MNDNEASKIKEQATDEVRSIILHLERDHPGVTEGLAATLGAGVGAAGSLGALSVLGVSGLSAAGITSGLATAGAVVGGGMAAGIGVLAAPVAVLAVGGFWLARKRKHAKLTAALGEAISKLYAIQNRLVRNAELFKEEIAGIKVAIEMLNRKKTA